MRYKNNCRTGDKISVLGFGTSYIAEASERDAVAAIKKAYEGGVNYYDLATAGGRTFSYFGAALSEVRKKVFYQIHFGADYASGSYGWSTDGETVKCSIDWQLAQLKTDYIDYGFIHCIDEALLRRSVAGCVHIAFWEAADPVSVHSVCVGQTGRVDSAAGNIKC